jgi:hypothetical protein
MRSAERGFKLKVLAQFGIGLAVRQNQNRLTAIRRAFVKAARILEVVSRESFQSVVDDAKRPHI